MSEAFDWIDPRPYADISLERVLLGLALHQRHIPPPMDILRPFHFFDPFHHALWTEMRAQHDAGRPIDPVLFVARLDPGLPVPHPDRRSWTSRPGEILAYVDDLCAQRIDPDFAALYVQRLVHLARKRVLWGLGMRFLEYLHEHARDELTADEIRRRFLNRLQAADLSLPQDDVASWADLSAAGDLCWDWPGWLPRGFLVLLAGQAGTGKSLLALRLAACYLCGAPWPDGTPSPGGEAAVLWCETEAAQFLNAQRARAWGLPAERIWTPLRAVQNVRLDDPLHRAQVAHLAFRPEVGLIVVDSLSGTARAAENTNRATDPVNWLADLARDSRKPVLLLHHLRKRGPRDAAAAPAVRLEHLRGHSGIVQPARIVLALDAPDPTRPDLKRLSVVKSNLAPSPAPLGFAVGAQGRLRFCEPPQPPRFTTLLDQAIQLLAELLAQGPLPAHLVLQDLAQAGISKRTAQRAKAQLRVSSIRQDGRWIWRLPPALAAPEPAPRLQAPTSDEPPPP